VSAEGPARPLVVAHRGASLEQSENTIQAFEAAIDVGADAVEFDVRMTADGHAVVMHDPDVSRTTDGQGLVSEMTLAELRKLGVPTLREALECLAGRAGADIEIKNLPGEPGFTPDREEAVEATLDALDAVSFPGQVIVSSFNPASIAHSRSLRPDVPTGLLTSFEVDAGEALHRATADGHPWVLPFVLKVLEAGDGFSDRARAGGALLGVWIADDPDTARRLFELGADAVATNDPRAIVPVRNAFKAQGRLRAQERVAVHMRRVTEELRTGDAPGSVETRRFLQEQGLDPSMCAVGGSFPEDMGQFTVLVDDNGGAYTYVLVMESGRPVLADWHPLDEEEMDTYSEFIEVGRAVLRIADE
jgi:glycerophosphoryl diester phosphodiesterase